MTYLQKTMKMYKGIIIFWTLFIGIGAVVGSCMFFLDPKSGFFMEGILPQMRNKLPFGDVLFQNFIFSGLSLLIVNGISNLIAFILIIKNKKAGYFLGFIFGITLMIWIGIQFYVFAPDVWAIDVFFFIFGFLQFLCGYLAYVNYCQLQFVFNKDDYINIKDNSDCTVVYFSRMGYTKKKAYEKANEIGCEVFEIKPLEKINGILGFWWCGRFGMHRWEMPIEDIPNDFNKYKKVYLFTPIWVFKIASPMRTFINKYISKFTVISLTLFHFCPWRYNKVFKEIEEKYSLEIEKSEYVSHFGNIKKIR